MTNSVKLPARLDLSAAQQLHSDLSGLDMSSSVTVDASDVTHFGTLCAQVLSGFSQSAIKAGGSVSIENITPKVEDQLATLGLSAKAIEGSAE